MATLLIVDDDMEVNRMLQSGLQAEGYAVVPAYDGAMALQLAQSRKPDLIIMDVNMPMTNGLKALEFLRKMPETAHIPVIFLSGAPSASVYPTVEKATRVAFIKKPLDLDEVISLVRQFLARYGPNA